MSPTIDVLDWCNYVRMFRGLEPVDHIHKGMRRRPGKCPIAMTVNYGGSWELRAYTDGLYENGNSGCSCPMCGGKADPQIPFPPVVREWVQAFDHDRLPQYELARGLYEVPSLWVPDALTVPITTNRKVPPMMDPSIRDTLAQDRAQALAWGNALRSEWGLAPVADIPPGTPTTTDSCALAQLVGQNYTFAMSPKVYRAPGADEDLPLVLELPMPVQRFEDAFESLLHPDLILA